MGDFVFVSLLKPQNNISGANNDRLKYHLSFLAEHGSYCCPLDLPMRAPVKDRPHQSKGTKPVLFEQSRPGISRLSKCAKPFGHDFFKGFFTTPHLLLGEGGLSGIKWDPLRACSGVNVRPTGLR